MIHFEETIFDLAYKGNSDALKSKIEEDPGLVNSKDSSERLLIHWAALGGFHEIVLYLIDHGSPVDPLDDIGMTPLILAASANKIQTVHVLIEKGANIDAQNNEGHSALQYAASKGWKQVLEMLIQNGANINIMDKRKATPLHRAASKGDSSIVSLLLKEEELNVNISDAYGNTPLHLACEESNTPVAKLLMQHGASIDVKNKEEKTPFDLLTPEMRRILQNSREL